MRGMSMADNELHKTAEYNASATSDISQSILDDIEDGDYDSALAATIDLEIYIQRMVTALHGLME